MNKTIITAALTGAITPSGYDIPATPERIAEEAYAAWKLGAAVVHLHMRDDAGLGTMDADRFLQTIRLIRAREDCDVIINCTSSGDARATEEERMRHLATLPGIEMGSYDAGSFNWLPGGVFVNDTPFLEQLGDLYIRRGIKPEIEVFDSGMISVANYMVRKGHLPTPCHFQFCLGINGAMPATLESLQFLLRLLPPGSTWSAFGIGAAHLPILFGALALGGHIRVGMEDNVVFRTDEQGNKCKATNAMLIGRAVEAVRLFGNRPATPAEAREMLGIPQLDGAAVRRALNLA